MIDPSIIALKETFLRIFRMRQHFRVAHPENIEKLKQRLFQNTSRNPVENITDFDLFYNIGSIFAYQPGPVTMGELSRELSVPLSTATRIVDWLVTNGYAERLPDADDRRIVRVALTEAGNAMHGEIDKFFTERIERLVRDFTPEERVTFASLLEKIITSMEKEV